MSNLQQSDISSYKQTADATEERFCRDNCSHCTENVFESIAQGDLLPIIFFSVLFGLELRQLEKKESQSLTSLKAYSKPCFGLQIKL